MFKDNKLRLLMTLAGFERLGIDDEPGATWIIPSSLCAEKLRETQETIERHLNNPVMEYGDEDPMTAEEMLRRASALKTRRAEYDDESEGDGIVSDGEEEFLFPAGGPTNKNQKSAALEELKKKRRKRRTKSSDDGAGDIDDETREARQKARKVAELEKRRKIKSNLYVRDSDEESNEEVDREFFDREEQRRKGQAAKVQEVLRAGRVHSVIEGRKRKSVDGDEARVKRSKLDLQLSHSDVEGSFDSDSSSPVQQRVLSISSNGETSSTPLSSPRIDSSQEQPDLLGPKLDVPQQKARLVGRRLDSSQERVRDKTSDLKLSRDLQDTDDEEVNVPLALVSRGRGRAVLLNDSDDE